jgi:hypothetical protein
MRGVLEISLFVAGFLLGLWYTTILVLPLFYGVPKALIGYFRKALYFKATLAYLVAPLLWTVFFFVVFLGLAFLWNSAFEYIRTSTGFNLGQTLGTILLVVNALFNKKARTDMKKAFDVFVFPYTRTGRGGNSD